MTRKFGIALLTIVVAAAIGAPVLAPHAADEQFSGLLNAPPMVPHIIDDSGSWRAPFVYPWILANRLEQRYEQDRTRGITLTYGVSGHFVRSADEARAPLLLAGTEGVGRDVFSRLLFGARTSLGIALAAALGATLLGLLIGGLAAAAGGLMDDLLMRLSDFVLLLPAVYVALALRAVLPLVLAPETIFVLLAGIFAVIGAPFVARGVRGIVRTEWQAEYALAARALGASPARVLWVHLLPAAKGFVVVQVTVLVPAFIVAEATLSYVGLGFSDSVASWGAMLHEAANARALADFPWLLSPAVAIVFVVLGINLALQQTRSGPATGSSINYNHHR